MSFALSGNDLTFAQLYMSLFAATSPTNGFRDRADEGSRAVVNG